MRDVLNEVIKCWVDREGYERSLGCLDLRVNLLLIPWGGDKVSELVLEIWVFKVREHLRNGRLRVQ